MKILEIHDLRAQYRSLAEFLRDDGAKVEPRGKATHELTDVALVLDSPAAATFPMKIGRAVSPAILAAELMQWTAGVSDLKQLNSVSAGRFKNYSDDGSRLYGAYGPRTFRGLERAVRMLQQDILTRQASVSLWGNLESDETKDLPCTLSWSFKIRDGKLEMMTVMRSNDMWTGVAYDIPSMARIHSAVAWAIRFPAGRYTHVAQSLHIYDEDIPKIAKLADCALPVDDAYAPLLNVADEVDHPAIPTDRWQLLRTWALRALRGGEHADVPAEFEWYAKLLSFHPGYEYFCKRCRYFLPQEELFCEGLK